MKRIILTAAVVAVCMPVLTVCWLASWGRDA